MQENNIFNRIYEQEVSPPPGLWNRIAQKLDEEEVSALAPVVSINNSKVATNWLKIALAACSVGFITMTTLWFVAKEKTKTTTVAQQISEPQIKQKVDTVYLNKTDNQKVNDFNTASTNLENGANNNYNSNNNSIVIKNGENKNLPNNGIFENNINKNTTTTYVKSQNTNGEQTLPANNNIKNNPVKRIEDVNMLQDNNNVGPSVPNEKAIANILSRISLASDNEELDSIINNSKFWKNQIQEWRTKLIKSGYAPTLINNLDLISLLKLLEEKK